MAGIALEAATEEFVGSHLQLAPTLMKAIELWGWEFHMDLLQEECGEAVVAVNHLKRGRCENPKVMEECADVVISAMAVAMLNHFEFHRVFRQKIRRLQERIDQNKRDKR